MEKNIFEGAKFGDKFVTRDGRKVVLLDIAHDLYVCYIEGDNEPTPYWIDGKPKFYEESVNSWDIISRYQEPIDEKKLDELACNEANEIVGENGYEETNLKRWYGFREGFIAGYRKSMEE